MSSTSVQSLTVGQLVQLGVEVPSQAELIWALANLMDGVKEHDVQGMTGLSEEDASRIYEIASRAIKTSMAAYQIARNAEGWSGEFIDLNFVPGQGDA